MRRFLTLSALSLSLLFPRLPMVGGLQTKDSALFNKLGDLAGQSTNALARDDVFQTALKRLLPPAVRSDTLYPDATARDSVVEVLGLPGQAVRLTQNARFVIGGSCRVHECSASKGLVVLDTENGALCAVIYHPLFHVDDNFDQFGRPLDQQIVTIDAEIFLPAADEGRSALLAQCAQALAMAVQDTVPDGHGVKGGVIRVRVAPHFSADSRLADLFDIAKRRPLPN